jgi:hypothetical protein
MKKILSLFILIGLTSVSSSAFANGFDYPMGEGYRRYFHQSQCHPRPVHCRPVHEFHCHPQPVHCHPQPAVHCHQNFRRG